MSIFKTLGKVLRLPGNVVRTVAKPVLKPLGLENAALSPLDFAGGFLQKGKKYQFGREWGQGAKAAALATGAAVGGPALFAKLGSLGLGGSGGLGGSTGSLFSKLGGLIGKTYTTPEGGLDLGRLAGTGMGISNILGARAQRKSAERSNAQTVALRNQLMSRILAEPQYNFGPQ